MGMHGKSKFHFRKSVNLRWRFPVCRSVCCALRNIRATRAPSATSRRWWRIAEVFNIIRVRYFWAAGREGKVDALKDAEKEADEILCPATFF